MLPSSAQLVSKPIYSFGGGPAPNSVPEKAGGPGSGASSGPSRQVLALHMKALKAYLETRGAGLAHTGEARGRGEPALRLGLD